MKAVLHIGDSPSPFSFSLSCLVAPDGETFDDIQPRQFGFVGRSVRTGERVTFAAHGCEAVEVERLPRRKGCNPCTVSAQAAPFPGRPA